MIQIGRAPSIPNSSKLADLRFPADSGTATTRSNFAPESRLVTGISCRSHIPSWAEQRLTEWWTTLRMLSPKSVTRQPPAAEAVSVGLLLAGALGPNRPSEAQTLGPSLFCGKRWDRIADGFGSRADNLDSVFAAESPPESGLGEVGSRIRKTCGRTSKPDRHAHHGRCIVAGTIANVRRCCRRADQDKSRQHRWVPGGMRGRAKSKRLPGLAVPSGIRPSKGLA